MRETSIVEVRELLELCSCSRKLCESWLHKLFNKNNYPLVQFHGVIKIMCQDLPLGWLNCLLVCAVQNRNFGCSARFYIFYWNVKRFWNFFHCLSIQIVYFSNFFRIFGFPYLALATDYYRLFCFWQILFFVCCLLILMNLWL